eukprot:m.115672 g.115672  ORF g.115672 m.115672 type:complete len:502 (-) comp15377_c0_seq2:389-1894(-)
MFFLLVAAFVVVLLLLVLLILFDQFEHSAHVVEQLFDRFSSPPALNLDLDKPRNIFGDNLVVRVLNITLPSYRSRVLYIRHVGNDDRTDIKNPKYLYICNPPFSADAALGLAHELAETGADVFLVEPMGFGFQQVHEVRSVSFKYDLQDYADWLETLSQRLCAMFAPSELQETEPTDEEEAEQEQDTQTQGDDNGGVEDDNTDADTDTSATPSPTPSSLAASQKTPSPLVASSTESSGSKRETPEVGKQSVSATTSVDASRAQSKTPTATRVEEPEADELDKKLIIIAPELMIPAALVCAARRPDLIGGLILVHPMTPSQVEQRALALKPHGGSLRWPWIGQIVCHRNREQIACQYVENGFPNEGAYDSHHRPAIVSVYEPTAAPSAQTTASAYRAFFADMACEAIRRGARFPLASLWQHLVLRPSPSTPTLEQLLEEKRIKTKALLILNDSVATPEIKPFFVNKSLCEETTIAGSGYFVELQQTTEFVTRVNLWTSRQLS